MSILGDESESWLHSGRYHTQELTQQTSNTFLRVRIIPILMAHPSHKEQNFHLHVSLLARHTHYLSSYGGRGGGVGRQGEMYHHHHHDAINGLYDWTGLYLFRAKSNLCWSLLVEVGPVARRVCGYALVSTEKKKAVCLRGSSSTGHSPSSLTSPHLTSPHTLTHSARPFPTPMYLVVFLPMMLGSMHEPAFPSSFSHVRDADRPRRADGRTKEVEEKQQQQAAAAAA